MTHRLKGHLNEASGQGRLEKALGMKAQPPEATPCRLSQFETFCTLVIQLQIQFHRIGGTRERGKKGTEV